MSEVEVDKDVQDKEQPEKTTNMNEKDAYFR
jgi:hypothetical protein